MRSKVLEGALAIGRQADTLGVDEARTRLEKVQSRASQRRADHRDGQVAVAAIPAVGAPLPPRRPERERTRVASAGQVALTSAQKKQTDPRAAR